MERKQSPTFLISSLPLKNLFRTFKDPLTWIHPALRHTIFVFQPASSCTPQSSAPAAPPIAVAFSQGFSDLVSCFGFCLLPPELSLITLARSTFLYWFTGWPGVLRFMGLQRVVSDSLWPYGLWHSRLPCPSPNSQRLLKLMSTKSVMPSKHLLLCCPLALRPLVFPSIKVFSNELTVHIGGQNTGASASALVLTINIQVDLFRIYFFDLLAILGTLKSLLEHHNLKHQFFSAQLSLWFNSHVHTWLLEKPCLWLYKPL